jgi:hypothetical protein
VSEGVGSNFGSINKKKKGGRGCKVPGTQLSHLFSIDIAVDDKYLCTGLKADGGGDGTWRHGSLLCVLSVLLM